MYYHQGRNFGLKSGVPIQKENETLLGPNARGEENGDWEEVTPSHPTLGSGRALYELSQQGPGQRPGRKWFYLPAGSAAGSSAGISFTHGPILGFFAPQGRHVEPIQVKFGREERTVGPLLPAKFDLDRFRGGGLRPPKLKKIRIFPI